MQHRVDLLCITSTVYYAAAAAAGESNRPAIVLCGCAEYRMSVVRCQLCAVNSAANRIGTFGLCVLLVLIVLTLLTVAFCSHSVSDSLLSELDPA